MSAVASIREKWRHVRHARRPATPKGPARPSGCLTSRAVPFSSSSEAREAAASPQSPVHRVHRLPTTPFLALSAARPPRSSAWPIVHALQTLTKCAALPTEVE